MTTYLFSALSSDLAVRYYTCSDHSIIKLFYDYVFVQIRTVLKVAIIDIAVYVIREQHDNVKG